MECERNSSADTKVSEGGGGAPAAEQRLKEQRFKEQRLLFKFLVLTYKKSLSNSFVYDYYELQPKVSLRVARARSTGCVILLEGMLSSGCDRAP